MYWVTGGRPYSRIDTMMNQHRKAQIGWVIYDFANTIFSMNIVTFYFSAWIVFNLGVEDIYYSLSYSASMILAAITMPSLGRLADQTGGKVRGLRLFTLSCVLFTVLLSLAAILHPGHLLTATLTLIFFAFANYFYEGGITYYNSLLVDVSSENNIGRMSGTGVALGYAGAIVGLLMVMPITDGRLFSGISGRQFAFLPTALLFLLFSLPTMLWIRERKYTSVLTTIEEPFFQRLWTTLKETRRYPGALRFLIGDFLVEDAIATTIVFMAIYAEAVVRFVDAEKMTLFIISTGFAFLGSFSFGYMADRFRAKPSLLIAVIGWVIVLTAGVVTDYKPLFYVIGALVGIFLGAVWTTSRPLLNTLVPREKLGQFYGLYTLSGRSAATIGPLFWGVIVLIGKRDMPLGRATLGLLSQLGIIVSDSLASSIQYRLALALLVLVMVVGLIILLKVPNRSGYSDGQAEEFS